MRALVKRSVGINVARERCVRPLLPLEMPTDIRPAKTSRTDPLQRTETYEYDVIGNLKKFTDRRGKVTSHVYDNLSRLTFVGFGTTGDPANPIYESTISYAYDTAGRVSQVTDSASGVVTFTYDNFSRMTSKITPHGTISYTYDAAGRRTSMTVSGQASVNYTYDNADRLTQVTQSNASISFGYDSAGRLTSMSRSNGILVEYTYDVTSNLTGIVFKKDAVVLGNLTYEYDAAGTLTKMSGSLARTGLPQPLTSVTHNAANQLTQRGAATLTYENNGNLTNDGTNTYTWNARNQLAAISGPGLTANFQYDFYGRRINKTINGVSMNYLYDGASAVQELSGTTPTANLLNAGVDKILTRTDGTGSRTPLMDQQGSTLALADDVGTLQTQYTYDPFGNTTTTGQANDNSSKYTGREDDGTGLYYYRARYYSPSLQRFISEDPIGFAGGDVNLYSYVGNNPINFVDPSGLCAAFSTFSMQRNEDISDPTNRIRIIDTGGNTAFERNKFRILREIEFMVNSGSCNAAFRKHGLATPFDLVNNGLITLSSTQALTSSSYNSVLGQALGAQGGSLPDSVRIDMLNDEGPARTLRNDRTGKAIIFFAPDAFDAAYLDEAVPHEFIHAGGQGRKYSLFGYLFGHDLSGFNAQAYADIMANCKDH